MLWACLEISGIRDQSVGMTFNTIDFTEIVAVKAMVEPMGVEPTTS
jgi:hypothetical protein